MEARGRNSENETTRQGILTVRKNGCKTEAAEG